MRLETEILQGLNPAQREAVEAIEGPLLIVAGPGSGKTRVITHRIAYLIRVCGISPHRILAVTFTNKAAREMKDRLQRLVGTRTDQMTVGTFHAFCAAILRRDGKYIGLDSNFTIYDDEDQRNLLKQAMELADTDPRSFPPRAIQSVISRAKCLMLDSHALSLNYKSYFEEQAAKVYQRYEELITRNNGVDFDDLLLKAVQILRNHPEALTRYQRRYVHILIDEFQDTNVIQYALAKLLTGEQCNLCVVGDADQSIYAWRHADIRNILSFQKDYPEAKTVTLEENYRSTGTILKAAKHLISANHMRLGKDLWTSKEEGHPVFVHEVYNEHEEAQFVIGEVSRLASEEGYTPGDCAVMYRVNAQSRALEEACLRYGMKYKLVGGVRFYQRREVKDIMTYLRLIHNLNDGVSLARVINVPIRGIGQRTMEDLTRWARSQDISLMAALELVPGGGSEGDGQSPPVSKRAARPILNFVQLVRRLVEDSKRLDVVELIDAVIEGTGYRQYLFDRSDRAEERWENIAELRTTAQEFRAMEPPSGLGSLLERLALVADVDNYEDSPEALTLITLHQAKGLEFSVVFMVGMEDGLLPHIRSMDSPEELEEERRLCYVGMTRSKERLYLTRSFRRGFTGGIGGPSNPSRFLFEIPLNLIRSPVTARLPKGLPRDIWEPAVKTVTELGPTLTSLKAGQKVRHHAFGDGMVVSCLPSGNDYEVTVAFGQKAGVKRLLLSYAHLETLE